MQQIHFLKCLLIVFALAFSSLPVQSADVQIDWKQGSERHWLGESLWGNRLQDWWVNEGRLECLVNKPTLGMRTVHLLTHRLSAQKAGFTMEVQTGTIGNSKEISHTSSVGFLVGVGGKGLDHRSAALVHQWSGPGAGLYAGVNAKGKAFIADFQTKAGNEVAAGNQKGTSLQNVTLVLSAKPKDDAGERYELTLTCVETKTGEEIDRAKLTVNASRVTGGVALVSHPGRPVKGKPGRYWFKKWKLSGTKITNEPENAVGPILCTQYTLSRNVLKLTAQLMPISEQDPKRVLLQTRQGSDWKTIAESKVIIPGDTAPFRITEWDSTKDVPYRVTYEIDGESHSWEGTIRHDPIEKETIVVAGFTGNHMVSHAIGSPRTNWKQGVWFPHADLTKQVAKHKPDLLFFSGDQVYEGRSPTFPDRSTIKRDYLYKWYLWCWAYRHLTKEIPTVTIPDDHDVYQGNIWGQGGRKSPGRDHHGGYVHPADFVKMVERTQTSHLPDPYDPTPIEQGIGVYYTNLTWGRISMAILEDRKFKSGCAREDMPPSGTGRPDHFNDPKFDVKKLDIPSVQLLGKRQLNFLRDWSTDWRKADMKMALSQTIFANMATHHGPGLSYLIADLDSNGWPQTGRNRALEELRRGFAFHLAGDQHLATIVHHGIEKHGDAIWSFCVPSVANFYPRAWVPEFAGPYRHPKPDQFTGERHDGFKHPVTVHAATNPGIPSGHQPADLHDKMPGYGIVKLNKTKRTITMECWPRFADPTNPEHTQYAGWPKTIHQLDNYKREPVGYLPEVIVKGLKNPVIKVINSRTAVVEYSLRIQGDRFRPMVFEEGKYTIEITEQEGHFKRRRFKQLEIDKEKSRTLEVSF